ncbi:amino acid permease [Candidatus Neomarinimicrobiota bacterium]
MFHQVNNKEHKLGFWLSTSLVVGNMTGSGIFLLPAALAVYGGISIFGWIFTTIGAVLLALVFSRLSKLITKPGGPYAYSREGFGDFTGFLVAWGYWISIWCGNAAIAVAGVGYLTIFFPSLKEDHLLSAVTAIGTIWFFTFINTKNIRSVGKVQFIITILKIMPLLLFGTLGFLYFKSDHFLPFNISDSSNFNAIIASAALTLWAFLGLESTTIPSDKIINPTKTIPRATIAGTLIVALIYVSSTVALMGIIAPSNLRNSAAPFADAAQMLWGNGLSYLVAIGAIISCFGALNGWILLQGQLPMAAARDNLFPAEFKKVSKKGIPLIGIIISSVLASILVSMNYSKGLVQMFSFIIMLSTLTCLVPYLVSSLVEITLYLLKRERYQKKQLQIAILISVPAFLYSLWAVIGLGYEIIIWGIILLMVGIPFFVYIKLSN